MRVNAMVSERSFFLCCCCFSFSVRRRRGFFFFFGVMLGLVSFVGMDEFQASSPEYDHFDHFRARGQLGCGLEKGEARERGTHALFFHSPCAGLARHSTPPRKRNATVLLFCAGGGEPLSRLIPSFFRLLLQTVPQLRAVSRFYGRGNNNCVTASPSSDSNGEREEKPMAEHCSLSSLPPPRKRACPAPPRAPLSLPSAASRQRGFEDQASPELLQVLEWSF